MLQELLEGTMIKRGTGMFVAWKERLFLLTSKQLVYFDAGRFSVIKGAMQAAIVNVSALVCLLCKATEN